VTYNYGDTTAYSGDACRRFRRFWDAGRPTLLQHIDAIDAAIGQIHQEVDARVEPFRTAIEILSSIPGINDLSPEVTVYRGSCARTYSRTDQVISARRWTRHAPL